MGNNDVVICYWNISRFRIRDPASSLDDDEDDEDGLDQL